MRPVIKVTTGKYNDENQILTSINYDQNTFSIFDND